MIRSAIIVLTLCLALTRWLTMCEPEVLPRPLQNHFLHTLHMTTQDGSWIAQYLHANTGSSYTI